jgi:hypothetical protein
MCQNVFSICAVSMLMAGIITSHNAFAHAIDINADAYNTHDARSNDDVVCILDRVIEYPKGVYHYYFKCDDGFEALIRDRKTPDEWKIGDKIEKKDGKWRIR